MQGGPGLSAPKASCLEARGQLVRKGVPHPPLAGFTGGSGRMPWLPLCPRLHPSATPHAGHADCIAVCPAAPPVQQRADHQNGPRPCRAHCWLGQTLQPPPGPGTREARRTACGGPHGGLGQLGGGPGCPSGPAGRVSGATWWAQREAGCIAPASGRDRPHLRGGAGPRLPLQWTPPRRYGLDVHAGRRLGLGPGAQPSLLQARGQVALARHSLG